MKFVKLVLTINLSLALSSCVSFKPDRDAELLKEQTPDQFANESGSGEMEIHWWETFGSDQLNRLMDEAFAGSLPLEQAYARLEQAEATARKSGADGKLQLDARGSASSTYSSVTEEFSDPLYSAGLYASYEVDLWGRIRSSERAELAKWKASEFDLQTSAMTLSAQLTQSYFKWLAGNETLVLYKSQLKSNRNKLNAVERRYKAGQATSLAVLQQRQQVASSEARIPPVLANIQTYEYEIAVFIGQVPGTDLQLVSEPLPTLPPRPEAGLPIALLENRPDIQAARLQLESADWSVSEARAARLPTLSLTGNIRDSDTEIEDLFDNWASSLAASLAAPLLDGGRRRAEVDRTLAVSREKIAAYRLAVLEAIQETEGALNSESHQVEYVEAVKKQHEASKKTEAESIRRYQRGILPFLDALTAIVSREALEITHVQARADLLADRIQLYRSLGGDWTFILEEEQ